MNMKVTSVFLYVDDVLESLEFYNEIVGAEVKEVHTEEEGGPISLALLEIGGFTLMLHPQEEHAEEFAKHKPGIGIHLQLRVDDVDAFYHHCIEEGALVSVSGEPVDQPWGWREFALKDPDGYVWSIYEDHSDGKWTGGESKAGANLG
ncbi:MAG: VOC family protein [Isosphaeraceae bacterium]|nr:VOC family protein [Isosphaeraceae bacterium]